MHVASQIAWAAAGFGAGQFLKGNVQLLGGRQAANHADVLDSFGGAVFSIGEALR